VSVADAGTPTLARGVEDARTRTISWTDPATLAAESVTKSGLEYLRGIAAGQIPRPPIAELIDSLILEIEPGRVVFACDPAEWMYNEVRYIRPLTTSTGRVLAEGRVVHAGRRTATAEGRLFVESDHSLIAHATTGCAILR
jgi:acyl-coenzyme A thioesterase PaaI-like protein